MVQVSRKAFAVAIFVMAVGCSAQNSFEFSPGSTQSGNTDTCSICHGSSDNAAPPRDTQGNTDVSHRGVGAHQAHLVNLHYTTPLSCSDCHITPTSPSDPGHLDGTVQVTFGDRATADGASPTWNGTTCAGVYCHGATMAGGSHTEPTWTQVDGTQVACGTCHGFPPPPPHPISTNCSVCHGEVVDSGYAIINKSLHINGEVNVSSDINCTACHGFPPALPHPQRSNCSACHSAVVDSSAHIINTTLHANGTINYDDPLPCNVCHGSGSSPVYTATSAAAPPLDLAGNSATSFVTIGAHQAHLTGSSNITQPVPCNECHTVPTDWNDVGHIDSLPADMHFGNRATQYHMNSQLANPVWDRNAKTCADTYCHSPDPRDTAARHMVPIWTQVDGLQRTCTSCHGFPPVKPSGIHAAGSPYSAMPCDTSCHSLVMNSGYQIVCKSKHMNGLIDFDSDIPCAD